MTDLPALPKFRKKREAQVTPRIIEWFKNTLQKSAVFEIKATEKNTIPASALAPHQARALRTASVGTLCHKISDGSRTQNPFDGFCVSSVPAYVVCVFLRHKVAYVIPIAQWQGARASMPARLYAYRIPL